MLFNFICQDAPNTKEAREKFKSAHRARLFELQKQNRLTLVGQLLDEETNSIVKGSLIVAEFDSLEQAKNWADADPYKERNVYESVTIQPFNKVLP